MTFKLEETTIRDIHAAYLSGRLTCVQLVQAYLDRISAYDQSGPALNAFVKLNPAALEEAVALDARLATTGTLVGPLHGIPVAVKDQAETKGIETRFGSVALSGYVPERDATIVTKMKAAGAIILGKTAMPDFAILGAGRWHGVPYSGMLLVSFLVVFGFVLARTIYGEAIYAVGGNYEASRLSGIRVRAVVASTYVLMGGCVGLAGSIAASQLSSAQANLDPGIIFDVLTIVVVGGTSLSGGSGAMWRTAVGLGIIATISNGFVLLDISPYYQSIIKGSIIVAALALDTGLTRLVRAK